MQLIRIFFLLFLTLPTAMASKKDVLESVLKDCKSLNHSEWVNRYEETELMVIEALEEDPKLSQSKDEDYFEVLFPQDLPQSHPMKNAYLSCFGEFHEYLKANNGAQSLGVLKKLEACYHEAYKTDSPPIVEQYMGCLKVLKY